MTEKELWQEVLTDLSQLKTLQSEQHTNICKKLDSIIEDNKQKSGRIGVLEVFKTRILTSIVVGSVLLGPAVTLFLMQTISSYVGPLKTTLYERQLWMKEMQIACNTLVEATKSTKTSCPTPPTTKLDIKK